MPKIQLLALVLLVAVAVLGLLVFLLTRGGAARPYASTPEPTPEPGKSTTPTRSSPTHWQPTEEVLALVRAGETIKAIKTVREETGLGLKDAKDIVDALAASRPISANIAAKHEPGAGYQPDADTLELVRSGRKIEAIKAVREATGMGLKEAKDFVESLERGG